MNIRTAPVRKSAVDIRAFKQAASRIASGCMVITTVDGHGKPHGLVMTAVTSLSLDPMQYLVCLDRRSNTLTAIEESRILAINILAEGQDDIATRFAAKGGDKFDAIALLDTPAPVPLLAGTLGYMVCRASSILEGGDHRIVICDAIDIAVFDGEPLLHFRGAFGRFGAKS